MPVETSDLRQYVTYWEANGVDNYGKSKVDSPVELQCRIEQRSIRPKDAFGETDGDETIIYLKQDVVIGSIIWIGRLVDVPSPTSNLKQVVDFNTVPDLKNRNHRRSAVLKNYSGSLPTVNS